MVFKFIQALLTTPLKLTHGGVQGRVISFSVCTKNILWNLLPTFFRSSEYLACKAAAATAKSLQSCPTLCDPIDGSPPGSPVPGILQARTLEWVAISFSSAWKWKVKVKLLSHVLLLATPWTAAHQAPPSMGSSRQEYCSGVPLPSPFRYRVFASTNKYLVYIHLCPYLWLCYVHFIVSFFSNY